MKRMLDTVKDRIKVCRKCGHHKFWVKPKGEFCTKCGRKRK